MIFRSVVKVFTCVFVLITDVKKVFTSVFVLKTDVKMIFRSVVKVFICAFVLITHVKIVFTCVFVLKTDVKIVFRSVKKVFRECPKNCVNCFLFTLLLLIACICGKATGIYKAHSARIQSRATVGGVCDLTRYYLWQSHGNIYNHRARIQSRATVELAPAVATSPRQQWE